VLKPFHISNKNCFPYILLIKLPLLTRNITIHLLWWYELILRKKRQEEERVLLEYRSTLFHTEKKNILDRSSYLLSMLVLIHIWRNLSSNLLNCNCQECFSGVVYFRCWKLYSLINKCYYSVYNNQIILSVSTRWQTWIWSKNKNVEKKRGKMSKIKMPNATKTEKKMSKGKNIETKNVEKENVSKGDR
jgi:hypothetical protein